MSLIEMESPNDEDLLKAPRSRPLWLATRQLQLLLSSDKFYGFEDLTAQTIGSDATAVVTPTKHKRKSLKVARRTGQHIEYVLKKGAKYFGIAVIKIFNQPQVYSDDARVCYVC